MCQLFDRRVVFVFLREWHVFFSTFAHVNSILYLFFRPPLSFLASGSNPVSLMVLQVSCRCFFRLSLFIVSTVWWCLEFVLLLAEGTTVLIAALQRFMLCTVLCSTVMVVHPSAQECEVHVQYIYSATSVQYGPYILPALYVLSVVRTCTTITCFLYCARTSSWYCTVVLRHQGHVLSTLFRQYQSALCHYCTSYPDCMMHSFSPIPLRVCNLNTAVPCLSLKIVVVSKEEVWLQQLNTRKPWHRLAYCGVLIGGSSVLCVFAWIESIRHLYVITCTRSPEREASH
jgi:hypothetical protein